jgi:4-hydroxy-tetrahydrodipicolinate reductase
MIKVAVVGAAGRMGRRLVSLIMESTDMKLCGAIEEKGNPALGQDAGMLAGAGSSGIAITDSLEKALSGADAMIDFSTGPAVENAKFASSRGVACVIGSTGLGEDAKRDFAKIADAGGRIVFASNMSVGVNLLFRLCREVAGILGEEYDIEVVEMHHRNKKDAPSGTALSLAEALREGRSLRRECCVHGRKGQTDIRRKDEIGMHAVRGGDVVGDHTVVFAAEGERIELIHKASSRDAFAKGALRAVRFLRKAKPGLYDMLDVLGFGKGA